MNNSKESSMTITSIAHFTQLQHYVHFYHMQKILYPQRKGAALSINMTAKTVRLSILENQNEQLQRELKNTLELYETADHCWKYNHDFNWENKKIMDYEANTTTRKSKEIIYSLSNNDHINGISYRLPHIWFPALKLKEGSEINTSKFRLGKQENNGL